MSEIELFKRKDENHKTIVDVGGIKVGGDDITIIAGPCSVESYEALYDITLQLKSLGVKILRGGAYKPRTSPYSFQGLKSEGLEILGRVSKETGLKVVTEVMDTRDVELVSQYCDILQIGARNMYNYSLLFEAGKTKKPLLLKRSFGATVEELLYAAEHVLVSGNNNVILCERGIKTFENSMRNTLDIGSIPVIKELSHLPIIVDPSHASGSYKYVPSLSKAAIAAGADGLMIEVHNNPLCAKSDGTQSLNIKHFKSLYNELKPIIHSVNRSI